MTTRQHNLALPTEAIHAFCRRHPIQKLSLFGSVLRDDFGENSDVDFLVELDASAKVGMFEFMRMQFELQEIVGRLTDLRTPEDLNPRYRARVVGEAELIFEANQ